MKTILEWVGYHVWYILLGQLIILIATLALTAVATDSFGLYIAIGCCASLLFGSSLAIVITVWWFGNAKVEDGEDKPKMEGE